jgi:hypothetical protein
MEKSEIKKWQNRLRLAVLCYAVFLPVIYFFYDWSESLANEFVTYLFGPIILGLVSFAVFSWLTVAYRSIEKTAINLTKSAKKTTITPIKECDRVAILKKLTIVTGALLFAWAGLYPTWSLYRAGKLKGMEYATCRASIYSPGDELADNLLKYKFKEKYKYATIVAKIDYHRMITEWVIIIVLTGCFVLIL